MTLQALPRKKKQYHVLGGDSEDEEDEEVLEAQRRALEDKGECAEIWRGSRLLYF